VDGFFESLGEAVGTFIRFIVENLGALFSAMGGIISSFITGLSNALGVTPSLLTIVVMLLGLWLLYLGARAFSRKSFIGGIIWCLLGLWLLSGLIA
jgi:ABC-type proline/glycine betaine transport system permease subunit